MNSRQKLGWTLILILVVFCCVCGTLAVGGFAFFGLLALPEDTGEAHLTKIARSASPIIQALEHYRSEHQRFPTDPADLASYLPSTPSTPPSANPNRIRGWYYHHDPSGQGYSLAYRLGWDPNLIYERPGDTSHKLGWDLNLIYECQGNSSHWEYDPGDGSPSKMLHLKP